jgi:hypothetical protein
MADITGVETGSEPPPAFTRLPPMPGSESANSYQASPLVLLASKPGPSLRAHLGQVCGTVSHARGLLDSPCNGMITTT